MSISNLTIPNKLNICSKTISSFNPNKNNFYMGIADKITDKHAYYMKANVTDTLDSGLTISGKKDGINEAEAPSITLSSVNCFTNSTSPYYNKRLVTVENLTVNNETKLEKIHFKDMKKLSYFNSLTTYTVTKEDWVPGVNIYIYTNNSLDRTIIINDDCLNNQGVINIIVYSERNPGGTVQFQTSGTETAFIGIDNVVFTTAFSKPYAITSSVTKFKCFNLYAERLAIIAERIA